MSFKKRKQKTQSMAFLFTTLEKMPESPESLGGVRKKKAKNGVTKKGNGKLLTN